MRNASGITLCLDSQNFSVNTLRRVRDNVISFTGPLLQGTFSLSDLDATLSHNFELVGRVELLGEDVEDENDNDEEALHVGDPVLVLPFFGQSQG